METYDVLLTKNGITLQNEQKVKKEKCRERKRGREKGMREKEIERKQ